MTDAATVAVDEVGGGDDSDTAAVDDLCGVDDIIVAANEGFVRGIPPLLLLQPLVLPSQKRRCLLREVVVENAC